MPTYNSLTLVLEHLVLIGNFLEILLQVFVLLAQQKLVVMLAAQAVGFLLKLLVVGNKLGKKGRVVALVLEDFVDFMGVVF